MIDQQRNCGESPNRPPGPLHRRHQPARRRRPTSNIAVKSRYQARLSRQTGRLSCRSRLGHCRCALNIDLPSNLSHVIAASASGRCVGRWPRRIQADRRRFGPRPHGRPQRLRPPGLVTAGRIGKPAPTLFSSTPAPDPAECLKLHALCRSGSGGTTPEPTAITDAYAR